MLPVRAEYLSCCPMLCKHLAEIYCRSKCSVVEIISRTVAATVAVGRTSPEPAALAALEQALLAEKTKNKELEIRFENSVSSLEKMKAQYDESQREYARMVRELGNKGEQVMRTQRSVAELTAKIAHEEAIRKIAVQAAINETSHKLSQQLAAEFERGQTFAKNFMSDTRVLFASPKTPAGPSPAGRI